MQPTNNKALYHSLGGLVDKLLNGEVEEAERPNIELALKATQQMISLTVNETNRAKALIEIAKHNGSAEKVMLREIEGKAFDNTI